MNHAEASQLLTRFVAADLDASDRRSVLGHLESCDECRDWMAASELLGALDGGGDGGSEAHLPSHDLATLAVEPLALDPEVRQAGEQHLARCPECRREIELVRASVEEARESSPAARPGLLEGPWVGEPLRKPALRLLVAGLVIAVGAWFGLSWAPGDLELTGRVLDGEQTVSARRNLSIAATEVSFGAAVVLESGRSVSFGDGFSVDAGAFLVVETPTDGSNDQDSSDA